MTLPLLSASHSGVRHAVCFFPIGKPALLELHRADVGQRRTQPPMIVEPHPVDHLVHRRTVGPEAHAVQARNLEPTPEGLRGRAVPAVTLAAHRRAQTVAASPGP